MKVIGQRSLRRLHIPHAVALEAVMTFMGKQYELMAVVNFMHRRSHYTAYVKRRTGPSKVDWIEYDDTAVITRSDTEVLMGEKAYLCFYWLKD